MECFLFFMSILLFFFSIFWSSPGKIISHWMGRKTKKNLLLELKSWLAHTNNPLSNQSEVFFIYIYIPSHWLVSFFIIHELDWMKISENKIWLDSQLNKHLGWIKPYSDWSTVMSFHLIGQFLYSIHRLTIRYPSCGEIKLYHSLSVPGLAWCKDSIISPCYHSGLRDAVVVIPRQPSRWIPDRTHWLFSRYSHCRHNPSTILA